MPQAISGSPEYLVGCVRMSIDFQTARDPVCDGAEVLEAAVAARPAAGELQQGVDRLDGR